MKAKRRSLGNAMCQCDLVGCKEHAPYTKKFGHQCPDSATVVLSHETFDHTAALCEACALAWRIDDHGALVLALEDRTADTIYVLTDGAPSAGRYATPTSLLASVERLNRYRLVRIHTVGFGSRYIGARWKGFLAALARAHDGVHVRR